MTSSSKAWPFHRLLPLLTLPLLWTIALPWCLAQSSSLSGQVLRALGPNRIVVEGPAGAQYQVILRGTSPGFAGQTGGPGAERRLIEDLVGRHVTVTDVTGSGGLLQGVVRYGNEDVGLRWLRDGLLRLDGASAPADAIEAYTRAEEDARAAGLGIWAGDTDNDGASAPLVATPPPPGGWKFRPPGPTGR